MTLRPYHRYFSRWPTVEEGIAAYVEVLVVPRLGYVVDKETRRVVRQRQEAGLVYVAWGAFHAGRNDFSVRGEVDELGLEKLGVVVKQVDRWLLGRLTTLNRNGRARGNGHPLIRGHSRAC
jgi:hypothetical protein